MQLSVDDIREMVHKKLEVGKMYIIDRKKAGYHDKRKEEDIASDRNKSVIFMECVAIHKHHSVFETPNGSYESFQNMELFKMLCM